MKVLLIYPPDRGLPSAPYASLPALGACLEQSGHEAVLRDINLEMFYRLMQEDMVPRYRPNFWARLRDLETRKSLNPIEAEEYNTLTRILSVPEHMLENASSAIRVMQSPDEFYDPDKFNKAHDDLANALRFYYGLNPLESAELPDLVERLFTALDHRPIDPIADAYREGIVADILRERPGLIGLSIPFMISYYETMKLVKHIREQAPSIPIVIGGVMIENRLDPLATDPRLYQLFDYVIVGEGDTALCELATALETGSHLNSVSNLYYQVADGTVKFNERKEIKDLNSLPSPVYAGLPLGKYLSPEPIASFQTSRGCYYGKCSFCSLSYRDNFRSRAPQAVVEDMVKIHETTGINYFLLWDSLSPPKTLKHIAREIKQRELGFHWFAETKFEKVFLKPEFPKNLFDGGCRFLQLGLESSTQRILDLTEKGNQIDEVDEMLDNIAAAGILSSLFWFIGFPGETQAEAYGTYDYIQSRRHKISLSPYTGTYTLLPDQPLFHEPERYGISIHRNTDNGRYRYTYEDGSAPYDRTELNYAFESRGDAKLLTHGVYLPYAVNNASGLKQLAGNYRMGPLAHELESLENALAERTVETFTQAFGRDPIKDFQAPPEPVQLVYYALTGETFRLRGREMMVFQALSRPTPVHTLTEQLGMDWQEMKGIIQALSNRGLIKFLPNPSSPLDSDRLAFSEMAHP
ncbi:MAG: radical SAM protein [Nitrospinota bacterium]|nr:radical SAM protein [Nitrospinota bacterium]